MKILADIFDDDKVIQWGVYDSEDNFVASFDSFEEAQQFIS